MSWTTKKSQLLCQKCGHIYSGVIDTLKIASKELNCPECNGPWKVYREGEQE